MIRKFFQFAGILLFIMSFTANVKANNLDTYREILISKNYTIRYENITPSPRITNKDRIELFGSSGMAVNQNDYLLNKIKRGIVVSSGDDRYEEVGDGSFDMCRLTKSNENFLFTKYTKDNRITYYGTKKNKVEANSRNYLAEIIEGQSYGDEDMSWLLNAMLPNDLKSADMPRYFHVKSGKLSNVSYEDYKSDDDNTLSAIRYYFEGSKLVKISAVSYRKTVDGNVSGRKSIIKINEFSSTPDTKFLSLPEGLEDITNRKVREEN